MGKDKAVKCYYCGEVIERFSEQVEKKIPMQTKAGQRMYRRQFHYDCLPKYVSGLEDKELRKEEDDEWNKVYKYFRKELLGLSETKPLQQHEIRRLLGLRLGQYYPQGNNTRILPRGYDFKTILITMKVVKPKIIPYLSSTNFTNHKHRIDGIMRYITGEINDVQKRLDMQKKSNEKLKQDKIQTVNGDYTSHLKRKDSKKKVRDGSDLDLGGLL